MNNSWDSLATLYGTIKKDSDITSDNADNILIAWPVILDVIKKYSKTNKDTKLLEYGCGTGNFANKLHKLGFVVTGIDSSEKMIQTARATFKNIKFLVGDTSVLSTENIFFIVTSIMTFQFIKNIEKAFQNIAGVLEPGGIFIFAVFNPTFVKECMRSKILFEDFDSFERPKIGIFNLKDKKIRVFIRTAQEYNEMLSKFGFKQLLESYPPFTKDFLHKYPMTNLINESEYLILGYRKI